MSLADDILAQDDTVYKQVTVSIWKDKEGKPLTLTVRSITGQERDAFEASLLKKKRVFRKGKPVEVREVALDNIRAKLLVLAICQAPGDPTPVFTEEQILKLAKKNAKPIDELFAVAQELSALRDEDVEELQGN